MENGLKFSYITNRKMILIIFYHKKSWSKLVGYEPKINKKI